jgi:conjugal transfer pilus assembly protein TrbC
VLGIEVGVERRGRGVGEIPPRGELVGMCAKPTVAARPSMPANSALMGVASAMVAAAILALGSAAANAQPAPAVTDADIARAQLNQPVITDSDIERARLTQRTPSDADLARFASPAAPKIDSLPQPRTGSPVDLSAVAKGFEAQSTVPNLPADAGPALLIFISFAMPEPTLSRLVDQAARTKASLLLRGFVNGSLRETVERIQRLIGSRQVAVQIDPQAFERFSISQTPSFVLTRSGAAAQSCAAGLCLAGDAFAVVAGDVSVGYALAFIARQSPAFASDADGFVRRLKTPGS